ncbi:MAG: rRNA pseudouridine synthase [Bacteroidetes bacterium]|nr:rRNA pseudouridine synthase [Bacteroidota bacterium]
MRQRNSSGGKSDFSRKRSTGKSDSRGDKPSFKREKSGPSRERSFSDKPKRSSDGYGKPERSFDKPKRSFGSNDKKRPFKKEGGFDKPKRSFDGDDKRRPFKKEGGYGKSERSFDKPRRSFDGDEKRSFKKEGGFGGDRSFDKPKRSYKSDGNGGFKKEGGFDKPRRSFAKDDDSRSFKKEGGFDRPKRSYSSDDKGGFKKESGYGKSTGSFDKPKRSFGKDSRKSSYTEEGGDELSYRDKKHLETYEKLGRSKKTGKSSQDGLVRLNRYIANAGICSRREADVLIASGIVTVNGKTITEMGFKVKPGDEVTYDGAKIRNEEKRYLLLNKPKDYITTMDDPQERRTVMELISSACRERLYPVGRLDRNTTGLLLFTNDGDLAAKLTHPKHNIKKVYHVTLNKKITPADFKQISEGIELEDGFIKPDAIEYAEEGKKDIGIEIHSGRNRIVRRIFEQLGYEVVKLDRVAFAGLTKKDIPRGKWRFLTPKEVNFLRMAK